MGSGNTGCNGFSGGWQGEGGELTFTEFAMTAMACEDPVMTWEQAFTRVLGDTRGFEIDGDTLELHDAEGETLATLER